MRMITPLALLVSTTFTFAQTKSAGESHHELAQRVIGELRLSDADKAQRLVEATAAYRSTLATILEERATTLRKLEDAARPDKPDGDAVSKAYVAARDRFTPLKAGYVATLSAELHPTQADYVKDGLTADAMPKLVTMYDEMVPGLKPIERQRIVVLLVEMRENAMTAIEHDTQAQWQAKYRGIINNYIAAQGHDFRTLSKAWDAKQPR